MSEIYGIKRRLLFHNLCESYTIMRAGEEYKKILDFVISKKAFNKRFRLFIPYTTPLWEVANRIS